MCFKKWKVMKKIWFFLMEIFQFYLAKYIFEVFLNENLDWSIRNQKLDFLFHFIDRYFDLSQPINSEIPFEKQSLAFLTIFQPKLERSLFNNGVNEKKMEKVFLFPKPNFFCYFKDKQKVHDSVFVVVVVLTFYWMKVSINSTDK